MAPSVSFHSGAAGRTQVRIPNNPMTLAHEGFVHPYLMSNVPHGRCGCKPHITPDNNTIARPVFPSPRFGIQPDCDFDSVAYSELGLVAECFDPQMTCSNFRRDRAAAAPSFLCVPRRDSHGTGLLDSLASYRRPAEWERYDGLPWLMRRTFDTCICHAGDEPLQPIPSSTVSLLSVRI